jgi:spore germination protein GerM
VACGLIGGPSTQPPPPVSAPNRIRTPLPEGVAATRTTLYFPRYFEDSSLGLRGVERPIPDDQPVRRALEALIQGPDGPERAADLNYPVNPHTAIVSFELVNGVVTVELGPELAEVRGRPYSELAYWSIVYTLTELPEVRGVALLHAGQPLREFGYPPVPIPAVASRSDAPGWAHPR